MGRMSLVRDFLVERILWIDVAKGLSILLVVLFHANMWLSYSDLAHASLLKLDEYLSIVRMPLLFAVSGFVTRRLLTKSLREAFVERIYPMIALYSIWTLIEFACLRPDGVAWSGGAAVRYLVGNLVAPPSNSVLWFLWALAAYATFGCATRAVPASLRFVGLLCITLGVTSFAPGTLSSKLYFVISYAPMYFGAAFYGSSLLGLIDHNPLPTLFASVTVLLLTHLLSLETAAPYQATFILAGFTGIALGAALARIIAKLHMPSNWLARLGTQTLPIYLVHSLLLVGLVRWLTFFPDPARSLYIVTPLGLVAAAVSGALVLSNVSERLKARFLLHIDPWRLLGRRLFGGGSSDRVDRAKI